MIPTFSFRLSVGLAAFHCLTDVAMSTCSFSDQQSPPFTVFHSILFSFFLVLLIVYNNFFYLLTFSWLLDPLTSSQASKDKSHICACHLTNLPPRPGVSAVLGAQLTTAHQVSIPASCEKVCPFVKVNDCFVGPLKIIHKIKGNLPEGFGL